MKIIHSLVKDIFTPISCYKAIVLFVFICSTILLQAQQDTTILNRSQEVDFFEDQQFVDAHDFVFKTFEETQSLWKLDLTGVLLRPPFFSNRVKYSISHDWGLSYERKISPAFSINSEVQLSYNFYDNFFNLNAIGVNAIGFGFGFQPRWYFDMKKKIAEGKTANNLSGNYLAFNSNVQYSFGENEHQRSILSIGLSLGIQKRIFGRGFIDIQFGPQMIWDEYEQLINNGEVIKTANSYFGLGSRIALGITIGKNKLGLDAAQRCDVFRCFREKRQLFKIDFLNAINFTVGSFNGTNQRINGSVSFSHEFKIGKYISINNELVANYSLTFYHPPLIRYVSVPNPFLEGPLLLRDEINHNFSVNLQVRSQFRHYYDLRKRIAQGKSANNLSGNYWGIEIRHTNLINHSLNLHLFGEQWKEDIQLIISPIWGLQRTIFKRAYIDYTLGFSLAALTLVEQDFQRAKALIGAEDISFSPFSRLSIGLAF